MRLGTSDRARSIRRLTAFLLLASAVAFALGVSVERSSSGEIGGARAPHDPTASAGEGNEQQESSEDGGEGSAEHEASERAGGHQPGEGVETLLGINPESTGLVAAALALSVLLALAVWLSGSAPLLLAVIAVALVFDAFDVRELIHQAGESRPGLASIAAVVALLHLGVAAAGAVALARGRA